jgi:hypothetical protein
LTTPTKKKKVAKKATVLDLTELVEPTEDVIKDGGSF